jgi:ribosomal protein L11 methyltransferase
VNAGESNEGGWYEIVLSVAPLDLDAASGLLASAGHPSCEIVERAGSASEIHVYVQCGDDLRARSHARELRDVLRPLDADASVVGEVPERIWREDWKRHFARTRIARRLEIVPPWESAVPGEPGRIVVVINPGQAFGTGQHQTTAACLELLERLMKPGDAVLDLGCGSGILAIAAAKLGAGRVLAIDNDPEAVNAIRENTVLNAVQALIDARLGDGPAGAEGFDLAIANILADTLVAMAADLTSCVKPDGVLVLSGIESEQRPLVEVAFSDRGWQVVHDIERSGWVSLALARGAGDGGRGR